MHSSPHPEHITLAHIKAECNNILNDTEILSLPAIPLQNQFDKIKEWQVRILNILSVKSVTIYSMLHNIDPDDLFYSVSGDINFNSEILPHEKQIYDFLISQIHTICYSVKNITHRFNTEYDTTAIPALRRNLLHHQTSLDNAISIALPDIEKFISDKLYWEEKLAVVIQSEEIIHQRGFQTLFGATTLPTAEQLEDVELSSFERFSLDELQRIISAVVNTLSEGLSYIQLVETRTTLSQRIYDLGKFIRDLEKDLTQLQDQMQEINNALALLPKLQIFNNLINAVLLHWQQSISLYEPYFSQSEPLPGLDTLILAHRRYFSAFIGMA